VVAEPPQLPKGVAGHPLLQKKKKKKKKKKKSVKEEVCKKKKIHPRGWLATL
jgi:hypothetical protein